MTTAWKIPRRWTELALCDRVALYPALYLRWSGLPTDIGRDVPAGRWNAASLRVLVSDGPLTDDERDLMVGAHARGDGLILLAQAGVAAEDRAFVEEAGCRMAAWTDEGPLASAPPRLGGRPAMAFQGCAARAAEDLALIRELALPSRGEALAGDSPGVDALTGSVSTLARPPFPDPSLSRTEGRIVAVVEDAAAFAEIWPALRREARRSKAEVVVTAQDDDEIAKISAGVDVATMAASDPRLLALIASARMVLCSHAGAAPDSPRPGQWVRSALYQGVPVIAASHPSIDGLAHLCVLDDWERGLALYGRLPAARVLAGARAQDHLGDRLDPERISRPWRDLAGRAPARPMAAIRAPLLLVLIDVHQDLDLLLPVLLALRARGEVRLRLAVTDWLVTESPRVLNRLSAHGFSFDVFSREEVRRGDAPLLGGVDGVLAGAETNVRPHRSGNILVRRAAARGAPSFTLQHGFENIGLTYKDGHHDETVRFASGTIFTWCAPEHLAGWIAPETRAAVVAVGSPKTVPPPASPMPLNQGRWAHTVGVFENLHWTRFSDAYRERFIEDLEHAARAQPETLFLIKPHHAGRWMSRHRDRIAERANLVVVDPTDSAWEPHTAPALIASVDKVLTTPSTVALDAARTGRPVAVLGYDLDLPLYEPLPIVRVREDLERFLAEESDAALLHNEAFLERARLPGRADHRIAALIAGALYDRPRAAPPVRRRRTPISA